jgi:TonB family protein
VPIDWTTSLTTRGTPLGEWVQRAEEIVDERWRQLDLGTHDRAVGIGGQVTVRYVVRPGGRVIDKWVDLSSGHPTLDDMALSAIPTRLPRLPKEVEHDVLHHRMTLRYRNPLVATGTPDP